MLDLKRPCKDCPFLKDGKMRKSLSEGRLSGIVDSLLSNDTEVFSCHKTIDYGDLDDDGIPVNRSEEQHCFGSMVYLQKVGRPHISQRIGYITGRLSIDLIEEYANIIVDEEDINQDRYIKECD